ncbi:hypothetical protein [Streptomyces alfalfae]|nr:hypothetical protein [Streptomyces alfalfae]
MTDQPYTSAGLRREPELVVLRQYGNAAPGFLALVVANRTAPGNRSQAGIAPGVVHRWPSSTQPGKPQIDPTPTHDRARLIRRRGSLHRGGSVGVVFTIPDAS